MNLFCQSVNFKDCPHGVGQKLVLDRRQQENFLRHCLNFPQISDALILNTCNRLEFYFYTKKDFNVSPIIDNFISHDCWNKHKQTFSGLDVAKHLFSVASGLESQIVGENEIFSQVKNAYTFALQCQTVKHTFHRLLHITFRAAKAVKTNTNISTGALSIAQAAVQLAADHIEIENAKAYIIGSGANAELVVKHLIRKKNQDYTIVARNLDVARQLIGTTAGKFLHLSNLQNHLSDADVVYTVTAAQEPLITAAHLQKRTKPLILIDLSVPPNIDAHAGTLDNVKLFNIDSLNEIISKNNSKRQAEVPKAQEIINEHVLTFTKWFEGTNTVPMVAKKVG
jgi:glutamyl-tRNA reductase